MSDYEHDFDDARTIMYDQLCEMLAEDIIDEQLGAALDEYLTDMYDNREQLAEQMEQAQQRQ